MKKELLEHLAKKKDMPGKPEQYMGTQDSTKIPVGQKHNGQR